jgi:hypothetical protein
VNQVIGYVGFQLFAPISPIFEFTQRIKDEDNEVTVTDFIATLLIHIDCRLI